MSYLLLTLLQRLPTALLRLPLECLHIGGAHLPTERGQRASTSWCASAPFGALPPAAGTRRGAPPLQRVIRNTIWYLWGTPSHTHTHTKDKDIWWPQESLDKERLAAAPAYMQPRSACGTTVTQHKITTAQASGQEEQRKD